MATCCPAPTYLASAVTSLNPCPLEIDQIVKIAFVRRGNKLTVTGLTVSASWTAKLAATGNSKLLVTPFLHGMTVEGGEIREVGGGVETAFGTKKRKGPNATTMKFKIKDAQQTVIATLKKLRCESLDAYFINRKGQILYQSSRDGVNGAYGVLVEGVDISDLKPGGYADQDINELVFDLRPDWSDNVVLTSATTFALNAINT